MADTADFDPDMYTKMFQVTKSMHRDNVIITGPGGTVGKYHIALGWATAGASVLVLIGRNAEPLEKVRDELQETVPGGKTKVIIKTLSIQKDEEVKRLYQDLKVELGNIDVLLNIAGVHHKGMSFECNIDDWWLDYEVHVKGSYLMSQYFFHTFPESRRTIINMATNGLGVSLPTNTSYIPSKVSLTRMTELIQLEHPEIRVFVVSPGTIPSRLMPPEYVKFAKDAGELIAGLTLYLNLDRADYLKGSFVSLNWDVNEMEEHREEIEKGNLLKVPFLRATMGEDGHPWKGSKSSEEVVKR